MHATTSVIIVGGGISGLSAAYELDRRGVPFTLLEASPRLGGLIRTDHVDGFTIEAGPESVLAQKPAALQLCEELGLGPRVVTSLPPRHAFILQGGQLRTIPSPSVLGIPLTWRGLAGYDLLPLAARARLALEPWIATAADPSADESVASFFARRFGAATVPLIAAPLLGGIHAGRIDALSMHSLFPRFVAAERQGGSVLRAFRRANPAASADGAFRSLSSGMGELVAAIGRRLPPGTVRLATAAATLTRRPDGWRVGTPRGDVEARALILAAPAYTAARLLSSVDHDASAICGAVPYVSSASIALAYPKERVAHPLQGSGFVAARGAGGGRLTACTWVSSKWAGRAPEGSVLLRAFIGGATDPTAIDLSDEALVAVALRELTPVLGLSGLPMLTQIDRWRDAGAQHQVGHLARLARLEQRLALLPGLFAAGAGFRAIGIPDCVSDGRAAAATAATFVSATAVVS
ncbi:MAG: protoporphyrinogen oxidase [Vicinamibacterales bacterium]